MTKRELVNELAKYGIKATTRARKDTLVELLAQLKKDEERKANIDWTFETGLVVAAVVMFVAGIVYNAV